jgi:D-arabinose 1-dehydrogenase-like Zn-dependent alcohol dehydrogenase
MPSFTSSQIPYVQQPEQVLPCPSPAFLQYDKLKIALNVETIEVDSDTLSEHSYQLDSDPGYESATHILDTDTGGVCFESTVTKPVRHTVVAVIGVGYVGFELVQAFSQHYTVIAFDLSPKRVATLQKTQNHLTSVTFTFDESLLSQATHFLVSVSLP